MNKNGEGDYRILSINEKSVKNLGKILKSDTAKAIINIIKEKEKISPLQISNKLEIPLSTVVYNLTQLEKEEIIEKNDFFWSEKGKKVHYYSLTNKPILIVPGSINWKDLLKKILPFLFILGIIGFTIKLYLLSKEVIGIPNITLSNLDESSISPLEDPNESNPNINTNESINNDSIITGNAVYTGSSSGSSGSTNQDSSPPPSNETTNSSDMQQEDYNFSSNNTVIENNTMYNESEIKRQQFLINQWKNYTSNSSQQSNESNNESSIILTNIESDIIFPILPFFLILTAIFLTYCILKAKIIRNNYNLHCSLRNN